MPQEELDKEIEDQEKDNQEDVQDNHDDIDKDVETKPNEELKENNNLAMTQEELDKLIEEEKQKAVKAALARNKKKPKANEVDTTVQEKEAELQQKIEVMNERTLKASLNYALSNNNLPKKAIAIIRPLIDIDVEDYENDEVIDAKVKELLEEHDYIKVGMQNTNKPNTEEVPKEKTNLELAREKMKASNLIK